MMSDPNCPNAKKISPTDERFADPPKDIIFEMIRASANDNVMPAQKWLKSLLTWGLVIGGVLAYALF